MSSLGGQWRVIRHYLSISNLNAEVEKLVQRIKPATPEQWENLIKKFERAVTSKLNQDIKNEPKLLEHKVNTTTVQETDTKLPVKEKVDKDEKTNQDGFTIGSDTKDITFKGIWEGLKLKKDLHFGNISESNWKTNKPIVSKTSIHSRTAYVISAIVMAETPECLLKRSEHFIEHLQQYPEARDYAIKEGAVRAFLRVQHKLKKNIDVPINKEVNGIVNEYLCNFNFILMTITASGIGNLDTANHMYHTLSKQMFGNTSLIGGTSRLVWTHSYYDTDAWEKLLQDNLRDCTLTECNRHDTPK
ncbi:calcium-independent phospholipase A2-gamma like protein, partial [Danaus plexippus plexippus]